MTGGHAQIEVRNVQLLGWGPDIWSVYDSVNIDEARSLRDDCWRQARALIDRACSQSRAFTQAEMVIWEELYRQMSELDEIVACRLRREQQETPRLVAVPQEW